VRFVGWVRLTPLSSWRPVVWGPSVGEVARKLSAYCRRERLSLPNTSEYITTGQTPPAAYGTRQ
jgi:hypothetical protein